MSDPQLPKTFSSIKAQHAKLAQAVEELGKAAKQEGPIDEKNAQLIQLAAAASIHSQGAVHSHARRAIEAGATPEEVCHAVILLTSTIGFPTAMAALSWVEESIKKH